MATTDSRRFPDRRSLPAVASLLIVLTAVLELPRSYCRSSVTLTRTAAFDVTARLPEMYRTKGAVLKEFAVKNDKLHFVFSTNVEPLSYKLIRTDLGGQIAGPALDLSGGSMHGLAVDDDSRAFLYRSSPSDSSMLECDFDSSTVIAVPVPAIPFLFLVSGNRLLGFTKEGTLDEVLHSRPDTPLSHDYLQAFGTTESTVSAESLFTLTRELYTGSGSLPNSFANKVVRSDAPFVNLASTLSSERDRVAYAACELHADAPTRATLVVGSDDGVRVWLNNRLCFGGNR
jgi:hypothetical protein